MQVVLCTEDPTLNGASVAPANFVMPQSFYCWRMGVKT